MLNIGQTAEAQITGYSSEGLGVCHIDGCAVFVPNAIRGELCQIKITHVSRNSAHGKIERILERSPHRISRLCPAAKLCGGCQYQHMDYAEELRAKAQKVTDALNRIGGQQLALVDITGADGITVPGGAADNKEGGCGHPPLRDGCASYGAEDRQPGGAADGKEGGCGHPPLRDGCASYGAEDVQQGGAADGKAAEAAVPPAALCYRNKAQYPVALRKGKIVAGFYRERSHEVVPVARCAILPPEFDRARDLVVRWAEQNHVSVYDERTQKGLLRHIYVRRGVVTGELMVCIVANGTRLPRPERLVEQLRQLPGLVSVVLAVNQKPGNAVLGEQFIPLFGKSNIEDELCGFRFRLSPRSFYQVNHDQAERLYARAVELAQLHGSETVLDLYCGTGTITLALSRRAGKAVGVEIIPQAIEDAKQNAARNGVDNTEFFCADATAAAARFAAQRIRPEVIVVDPPRKGLAPEVVSAMLQMAPQRIVYVSCDPATLARDLKLLTAQDYRLTHAEAFDLFPRTYHVETVVLITRP